MKKVEKVERKSMKIRPSFRSSDYISPSFGHGCLLNCRYCYMKRHKPDGLSVATNDDAILNAIIKHHKGLGPKIANQTHSTKWTYDISCNEDFLLHHKYHDWDKIFTTLIEKNIMPTFATKVTMPQDMLNWGNQYLRGIYHKAVRIRYSLMPESYRQILEPNSATIEQRMINAAEALDCGFDVHFNYSPVIVREGWRKHYRELFSDVGKYLYAAIQMGKRFSMADTAAEVIFLTHNDKKHMANLLLDPIAEQFLWTPQNQEPKISKFGGRNIRYKASYKKKYINNFRDDHQQFLPYQRIRYIF